MAGVIKVAGEDVDALVEMLANRPGLGVEYRKQANANWAMFTVDCGCEDTAAEVACDLKRRMADLGFCHPVNVSGAKIHCNFGIEAPWGRMN